MKAGGALTSSRSGSAECSAWRRPRLVRAEAPSCAARPLRSRLSRDRAEQDAASPGGLHINKQRFRCCACSGNAACVSRLTKAEARARTPSAAGSGARPTPPAPPAIRRTRRRNGRPFKPAPLVHGRPRWKAPTPLRGRWLGPREGSTRTSHHDPSSWRWRLVDGAFWAWWRAGRPDWTC